MISTAGSIQNAPWGELLSTAAKARGGRGAVVDGLVRDVRKIEQLGFPVFARGIKPVDSKGRGMVIDYNVPVDCAGVLVSPGDLVVADYDGVIVVPAEVVPEVICMATEKVDQRKRQPGRVGPWRLPAGRLREIRRAVAAWTGPGIRVLIKGRPQ